MEVNLEARRQFFRMVFARYQGFVCIAFSKRTTGGALRRLEESFFEWPDQEEAVLKLVEEKANTHDVYFCPQLLSEPRRNKNSIKLITAIWADLDECHPDKLLVPPSISMETSPKRYQAFWVLERPMDPDEGKLVSKRIAYHHEHEGVDPTGWILTKLMRIPGTRNFKYQDIVLVEIIKTAKPGGTYRINDFSEYPEIDTVEVEDIPFPAELPNKTGRELLMEYRRHLDEQTLNIFSTTPLGSWYPVLHKLEMGCFEAGMSLEETFIVARDSNANKFSRDERPQTDLWQDVLRAHAKFKNLSSPIVVPKREYENLVTDEERKQVEALGPGFVERYVEWAKRATDAPSQYHEAGAFIILSSVLSGRMVLPTSFGNILPNLWFMILAETTLTRKTTSMNMAMKFLNEVDDDIMLATDGSIEGLLTSLSFRPNRPSIFLKDEFSGLLDQMKKKDYYSGMSESLTQLYDGNTLKRVLRKDVITVREPMLIIFASGIKNKVISLLEDETISSGFIPRFVMITGSTDIDKLKPLGPPVDGDILTKNNLIREVIDLAQSYNLTDRVTVSKTGISVAKQHTFTVKCTKEAFNRYNQFNIFMLKIASESRNHEAMIPIHERLCVSTLKAAMLIAAERAVADPIIIEEQDILRALVYCESWRKYTAEVMNLYGRSYNEQEIGRIVESLQRYGGVMRRSELMNLRRYTKRDMDNYQDTMEQRSIISVERNGKIVVLRLLGGD